MDEARYQEILPTAYLAAAIEEKGKPSSLAVGLHARALEDCKDTRSLAYRIAMAQIIPAEIQKVEKVTTSFGVDKFIICYYSLANGENERMGTPLLNDRNLGALTKSIWDNWEPDGRNTLEGKIMLLYKHNDPPREGDRSTHGYRCCVYASGPYSR